MVGVTIVGLADNTRLVVPVELVTSLMEETRFANVAEVPKTPPELVVTNLEAARPEKVIVPEEVNPVKEVSAPAIVELPVTAIPPDETVKVVTLGEVAKTKSPVPVVPVTEERRSADAMLDTRFFEASVATKLEAVRPEKLMVPEAVRFPEMVVLSEKVKEAPEPTAAKVIAPTLETEVSQRLLTSYLIDN